jgi:hypothetical protein
LVFFTSSLAEIERLVVYSRGTQTFPVDEVDVLSYINGYLPTWNIILYHMTFFSGNNRCKTQARHGSNLCHTPQNTYVMRH